MPWLCPKRRHGPCTHRTAAVGAACLHLHPCQLYIAYRPAPARAGRLPLFAGFHHRGPGLHQGKPRGAADAAYCPLTDHGFLSLKYWQNKSILPRAPSVSPFLGKAVFGGHPLQTKVSPCPKALGLWSAGILPPTLPL